MRDIERHICSPGFVAESLDVGFILLDELLPIPAGEKVRPRIRIDSRRTSRARAFTHFSPGSLHLAPAANVFVRSFANSYP